MSDYANKLKDPRWQKKRLEIMDRDGFACRACNNRSTTLNVHHKSYTHGLDPWEYANHNLVTLCASCHSIIHKITASDDGEIANWLELAVYNTKPSADRELLAIIKTCGEVQYRVEDWMTAARSCSRFYRRYDNDSDAVKFTLEADENGDCFEVVVPPLDGGA